MKTSFGGARILIVEDDFPIRLLLAEFLCDEGFDITEAETGDQAIRLFDRHEAFDLLLTDISLPGRADGNAVAARAKQLNPDLPVLYSSACPESLRNKIGPCDAFVSKPFKMSDMIAVVQKLLLLTETHRIPQ